MGEIEQTVTGVSTHSRLKAAGFLILELYLLYMFQHTAA